MTISDSLRQALVDGHESLDQIALATGISLPVLYRFVNGRDTGHLSLANAERLANHFRLRLSADDTTP